MEMSGHQGKVAMGNWQDVTLGSKQDLTMGNTQDVPMGSKQDVTMSRTQDVTMVSKQYKALPIGVDDFYDMRSSDFCYVDKTFFIQRLLDTKARAMLFTRPRRFGKTLALDMLRCFFDCNERERNRPLFEGLSVTKSERCMAEQGKYPVIFLNFKEAKGDNRAEVEMALRNALLNAMAPIKYLLQSDRLDRLDKVRLEQMIDPLCPIRDTLYNISTSMGFVCSLLAQHHGQPVVFLVDEYDTPLQSAYLHDCYQPICNIICNLFSSALKSNHHLRLGVITGVMRIAKDSLFSGLNNLKVDTIFSEKFADCFGFTPAEVDMLAKYYGAVDKRKEIEEWYDGYHFGQLDIYNPWSVLQYFDEGCKAQAYWLDTSSNDLTIDILRNLEEHQRQDVEKLYLGGTVEAVLDTSVAYRQMDNADDDIVFSLMTMTGYLKPVNYVGCGKYELEVPNAEINAVFAREIISYLERGKHVSSLHQIWNALRRQDNEAFAAKLKNVFIQSSSYHCGKEAFYHGFMMCLLLGLDGQYQVLAEREAGLGRADILLQPRSNKKLPGFVFELKRGDDRANLNHLAEEALQQIAQNRYADEFPPDIREVRCYGLAFCKKECEVRMASVVR